MLAHHGTLQVLVCAWYPVIHNVLAEQLAGDRVKSQHTQAAVEERRSTGDAEEHIILDQRAPVQRPDRLDLPVGCQSLVHRRGAESPRQLAVDGRHGIDVAVGTPEHRQTTVNRGR